MNVASQIYLCVLRGWALVSFSELFNPLARAEHRLRQRQMAAFFQYRDQPVEIRPGVRPGDDDADGMKQFFALCPGLRFDFVHNFFELLGSEVACLCGFVF